MNAVDESWLITSKSEHQLDSRQVEMYREHRREVLNWMLNAGKEPEAGIGYAE